ncbi:MAG: TatD family hydrolase [Bacteroidales bacterium]|nr:TatD family hydrolase [Bacteroidales bacterium]
MTRFINIHTHSTGSGSAFIEIINMGLEQPCPEHGLYSYGIHPWEIEKIDFQEEMMFSILKERLAMPNVVALGEAGLDKFHGDFERQMKVFERQIVLAENLKKPMILHAARSNNEIIALRKKHRPKQPWILHGFNGTEQDARQLIGQGICLSVGESLLHPERKICKSLKFIDLDHLFLETDMAEIGIEKVYEAAANLLEMDINVLKTRIFANFAALWNTGKTEPAS